jgi:ribosome biogenesis GTPase A
MKKACSTISKKINQVDVFIEVRDARAPLSSANNLEISRPKLILLNKTDLCSMSYTLKIVEKLRNQGEKILLYSATTNENMKNVMKYIHENIPCKFKTVGSWMMVGGVPNVGKSSVINAFRSYSKDFANNSPAKTGPKPCVTRGVSGFKVSQDPLMFLVDTPGILLPKLENKEQAMKLALIGAIKDDIVGLDTIADYMLFCLNKIGNYNYVKKLKITKPCNDFTELIHYIKPRFNWDELSLADHVLKQFREGKFGRITIDRLSQLPD